MWEEKKSKSIVIIVQNKKLFSIITVNRLKMEERNRGGKKRRNTGLPFGKENKKLLSITMCRNILMGGKKRRERRRVTDLSFGKENKKLLSITIFNPSWKKKDPSLF